MGGTKRKKFHYDEQKMPMPDTFSKGSFEGKSSGNSRRASVLNKLFMRHVTDQMMTGEYASMVVGHGIEINRVKVSPDYKFLRVYWSAKASNDIEPILQRCAGLLRHELSQLRVMGCVPIIQFVKDKHYSQIIELDKRLATADFGPDHTPQNLTEKFKTEFEISMSLESNVKDKILDLEKQESDEPEDISLPAMPQNVLGLNHAEILGRIKKSTNKSKAFHRNNNSSEIENKENFERVQTVNEDPVNLGDAQMQRAAFKQFLYKRQLMQMKAKRANRYGEFNEDDLIEEQDNSELKYANKSAVDGNEDFIVKDVDEKY
ncbi:hypothetical protein NQ317_019439 [Molorchus minor]|uniref:Ribosome-binding factor A n=1 Tax=Molorchus minor TaxID=1323400 RepID=A0ABQ9JZ34_9CUCU|nr:hypothetical protein NQ317_019439 [Molorchus minor]